MVVIIKPFFVVVIELSKLTWIFFNGDFDDFINSIVILRNLFEFLALNFSQNVPLANKTKIAN